MLCILLWISPLPELIKKINDRRRRNNLAKKFFQKFRQENFVDSFKRIHGSDGTNSEYTFHDIIDRLKREQQAVPNPTSMNRVGKTNPTPISTQK